MDQALDAFGFLRWRNTRKNAFKESEACVYKALKPIGMHVLVPNRVLFQPDFQNLYEKIRIPILAQVKETQQVFLMAGEVSSKDKGVSLVLLVDKAFDHVSKAWMSAKQFSLIPFPYSSKGLGVITEPKMSKSMVRKKKLEEKIKREIGTTPLKSEWPEELKSQLDDVKKSMKTLIDSRKEELKKNSDPLTKVRNRANTNVLASINRASRGMAAMFPNIATGSAADLNALVLSKKAADPVVQYVVEHLKKLYAGEMDENTFPRRLPLGNVRKMTASYGLNLSANANFSDGDVIIVTVPTVMAHRGCPIFAVTPDTNGAIVAIKSLGAINFINDVEDISEQVATLAASLVYDCTSVAGGSTLRIFQANGERGVGDFSSLSVKSGQNRTAMGPTMSAPEVELGEPRRVVDFTGDLDDSQVIFPTLKNGASSLISSQRRFRVTPSVGSASSGNRVLVNTHNPNRLVLTAPLVNTTTALDETVVPVTVPSNGWRYGTTAPVSSAVMVSAGVYGEKIWQQLNTNGNFTELLVGAVNARGMIAGVFMFNGTDGNGLNNSSLCQASLTLEVTYGSGAIVRQTITVPVLPGTEASVFNIDYANRVLVAGTPALGTSRAMSFAFSGENSAVDIGALESDVVLDVALYFRAENGLGSVPANYNFYPFDTSFIELTYPHVIRGSRYLNVVIANATKASTVVNLGLDVLVNFKPDLTNSLNYYQPERSFVIDGSAFEDALELHQAAGCLPGEAAGWDTLFNMVKTFARPLSHLGGEIANAFKDAPIMGPLLGTIGNEMVKYGKGKAAGFPRCKPPTFSFPAVFQGPNGAYPRCIEVSESPTPSHQEPPWLGRITSRHFQCSDENVEGESSDLAFLMAALYREGFSVRPGLYSGDVENIQLTPMANSMKIDFDLRAVGLTDVKDKLPSAHKLIIGGAGPLDGPFRADMFGDCRMTDSSPLAGVDVPTWHMQLMFKA